MNMARRLLAVMLSLYAVTIVACGGGGGSESEDTDRACEVIGLPTRVINGTTCGGIEDAVVVRVMAEVDLGGSIGIVPICTGAMVAPDSVLTAAHCFVPEVGGDPVVGLGIYTGEPGEGAFVAGVSYSIAPDARFEPGVGRMFNDAALIRLERGVNLPVIPILLSRPVEVGEPGFVYGYGQREEGENPDSGTDFFTLEAGAMTVREVTANHIFVVFSGDGVNVCFGDSGGPLVVEVDGQPAVAGVVSQGTNAGCESGDVTTFTNLQSPTVLNWLAQMVPDAYVRAAK
jgi:secreted trypsin-like serine protease